VTEVLLPVLMNEHGALRRAAMEKRKFGVSSGVSSFWDSVQFAAF